MTDKQEHRFRIIQGGFEVAGATCWTRADMEREMRRYAMMYQAEGPMKIQMRSGKSKWKDAPHD